MYFFISDSYNLFPTCNISFYLHLNDTTILYAFLFKPFCPASHNFILPVLCVRVNISSNSWSFTATNFFPCRPIYFLALYILSVAACNLRLFVESKGSSVLSVSILASLNARTVTAPVIGHTVQAQKKAA